jgi:hypothetical protein
MEKIIQSIIEHWAEILILVGVTIWAVRFIRQRKGYKSPFSTMTEQHVETIGQLRTLNEKFSDMQVEVWRLIIHDDQIPKEERIRVAQLYANAGYNGATLEYCKKNLFEEK